MAGGGGEDPGGQDDRRRTLFWRACKRDDHSAFRELLDDCVTDMWRAASRVAHCPEDAADAVQDACEKLWRLGRRSYDFEQSFNGYLWRIVHNATLDVLRAKSRIGIVISDGEFPDASVTAPNSRASGIGDDAETNLDLYEKVGQLPPHEREVICLLYFEDLTHEEAAVRLNIPAGTLKSRLNSGLNRLRRSFTGNRSGGR